MSALSIQVPFPVFQDRDGQPLENGYVWVGVANLNPQTNPVVAYYDAALTIPAPQPLRTLNGYISRAGTPAQIYVDAVNFSILVQDGKGSMVYSFADGTGISPDACGVIYDPPFTGGVPIPVCEKLAQYVSVMDFGAVGNGSDSTNAIQAALNYCVANEKSLLFPSGTYLYAPAATLNLTLLGTLTIQGSDDVIINVDFDGIVFNVNSFRNRQFFVSNITWTLLNPGLSGNADTTLFYIQRGIEYGSHFFFSYCNFNDFTNSPVTAIRAYKSGALQCNFNGYQFYYNNCANVRLWGADGTLTPQEHNFSNLCLFTSCQFVNSRVGFDGASCVGVTFDACTFEFNYIGCKNTRSVNTNAGIISSPEKGGFQIGTMVINDNCWFESNQLVHVTNLDIDPDTGAVINPGTASIVYMTPKVYLAAPPRLQPELVPSNLQYNLSVYRNLNGTAWETESPDALVLYAFTNNPDKTYYQYTNTLAATYVPALVATQSQPVAITTIAASVTGARVTSGSISGSSPSTLLAHTVTSRDTSSNQLTTEWGSFGLLNFGYLGTFTNHALNLFTNSQYGIIIDETGDVYPTKPTGTANLGRASNRWDTLYAVNGTINTSDANQKQDVLEITEQEKQVAARIKTLMRTFRFKDSVKVKGENARIHVGVIAQDVEAAFTEFGLDANRYALFCSDTWYEYNGQPVEVNSDGLYELHTFFADGEEIKLAKMESPPEGCETRKTLVIPEKITQLGIRYDELLAFVVAAL